MVRFGGRFVARTPVTEIVAIKNPGFLEQADGAIDRRDRDAAVDLRCAFIERLDVGMVFRIGDHPRDDPALLGDPQPLFVAERFEVDGSGHAGLSCLVQSYLWVRTV